MIDFVDTDGTVRWQKVVEFNSARARPSRPRAAQLTPG